LYISFSDGDSGSKGIPQAANVKQSLNLIQYWGATTAVTDVAVYETNSEGTSDILIIHRWRQVPYLGTFANFYL
jgi:hypothetical protein